MLTPVAFNHQKFTITLQMHKIIKVFFFFFFAEDFVPSVRNMLHAEDSEVWELEGCIKYLCMCVYLQSPCENKALCQN